MMESQPFAPSPPSPLTPSGAFAQGSPHDLPQVAPTPLLSRQTAFLGVDVGTTSARAGSKLLPCDVCTSREYIHTSSCTCRRTNEFTRSHACGHTGCPRSCVRTHPQALEETSTVLQDWLSRLSSSGIFDDEGHMLGFSSSPIRVWKEDGCVEVTVIL